MKIAVGDYQCVFGKCDARFDIVDGAGVARVVEITALANCSVSKDIEVISEIGPLFFTAVISGNVRKDLRIVSIANGALGRTGVVKC